ncbi:MAG: hypothetical protein AAB621_00660 [Patescibacteria group bacterium]
MGKIPSKKLFVYEEDEQGYWVNHVLMAQEGAPINTKRLEKLSWNVHGAGRFSTSVEALIKVASGHGLRLRIIKYRKQSKTVPPEWISLPLVHGATGNY